MLVRALTLVALTATVSSCRVNADYREAGFACSDSEPCQAGFACSLGICESQAALPDANRNDARDPNDPDAEVIECLPVIALTDEFAGDTLNPQWTEVLGAGTLATVSAGVLSLTPRMNTTPPRFARVRSMPFAFDGKRVFAELPMMVDTSTGAIGELQLATLPDTHFFLRQSQGILQFGTTIGGAQLVVAATDYDPAGHLWWQMRVTQGRVYADLSADGSTWVNLDSVASDVIVGDLYVEFSAGTIDSVAAPGLMQVDNVNAVSGLCL